ncbi:MAG TPA: glycosyltransferase [Chroococcidiopsis sp.]
MIRSMSVIVPVYNCGPSILDTLTSIQTSIQFFRQHYSAADQVQIEVVVVNDASTDGSDRLIQSFTQQPPGANPDYAILYTVLHHSTNQGAAAARNTGVRQSSGEILFFCDGDDRFLAEHLYVGYRALNQEAPIQPEPLQSELLLSETVRANSDPTTNLEINLETNLETNPKTHLADAHPPQQPVAVVKTQVKIRDFIHPYWLEAIANTLPSNLCLRRECHTFIEGFPEHALYRQIGREDITYMKCLGYFFKVFKANIETVEYIRYPGNSLDRQIEKFQTPPERYTQTFSPREQELHNLADQLDRERLQYLVAKVKKFDPRYTPAPLIQWPSLIQIALDQRADAEAIDFYERAQAVNQAIAPPLRTQLAKRYNALGVTSHTQKQFDQAAHYFQQALATQPQLSAPDQSRLYLNLGFALEGSGHYSDAIAAFQAALARDPSLSEAKVGLVTAHYRQLAQQRGYQFDPCPDATLLHWSNQLARLAHQPDLTVLELGSADGRLTCWLLDYILTQPTSRLITVDRDDAPDPDRFQANLARTGTRAHVTPHRGDPLTLLPTLPPFLPPTLSLICIRPAIAPIPWAELIPLLWDRLKPTGILLIDQTSDTASASDDPQLNLAIAPLLQGFCDKIKVLHPRHPLVIEKLPE